MGYRYGYLGSRLLDSWGCLVICVRYPVRRGNPRYWSIHPSIESLASSQPHSPSRICRPTAIAPRKPSVFQGGDWRASQREHEPNGAHEGLCSRCCVRVCVLAGTLYPPAEPPLVHHSARALLLVAPAVWPPALPLPRLDVRVLCVCGPPPYRESTALLVRRSFVARVVQSLRCRFLSASRSSSTTTTKRYSLAFLIIALLARSRTHALTRSPPSPLPFAFAPSP